MDLRHRIMMKILDFLNIIRNRRTFESSKILLILKVLMC